MILKKIYYHVASIAVVFYATSEVYAMHVVFPSDQDACSLVRHAARASTSAGVVSMSRGKGLSVPQELIYKVPPENLPPGFSWAALIVEAPPPAGYPFSTNPPLPDFTPDELQVTRREPSEWPIDGNRQGIRIKYYLNPCLLPKLSSTFPNFSACYIEVRGERPKGRAVAAAPEPVRQPFTTADRGVRTHTATRVVAPQPSPPAATRLSDILRSLFRD